MIVTDWISVQGCLPLPGDIVEVGDWGESKFRKLEYVITADSELHVAWHRPDGSLDQMIWKVWRHVKDRSIHELLNQMEGRNWLYLNQSEVDLYARMLFDLGYVMQVEVYGAWLLREGFQGFENEPGEL